ncbi:VCBS domain-containing protein, partial [Craterilacuibacter sp.]|uniref:VCBS domain-containing protein n=1 Tax=Craterilacuibacter sp. TaxID=2870909 RepID=UPI003F388F9F
AFNAGTIAGRYGSLVLGVDGKWTYTLDARANALTQGQSVSDSFTVTLNDGSTTTVAIDITGSDDLPVITSGSGSVVEKTQPSTSGTLTATDADNPGLAFVGETVQGEYGRLMLSADGSWSYTLDGRADTLLGGQIYRDVIVLTLNDGSRTTVTIRIDGLDDDSGSGGGESEVPGGGGSLPDVSLPGLSETAPGKDAATGEIPTGSGGGKPQDEIHDAARNGDTGDSAPAGDVADIVKTDAGRPVWRSEGVHAASIAPIRLTLAGLEQNGLLLQGAVTEADLASALDDLRLMLEARAGGAQAGVEVATAVEEGPVVVDVLMPVGAVLSVGFVWWAVRIGGLLAGILATAPAWRGFDPLPVLGGQSPDDVWTGQDGREALEDEQAVSGMWTAAAREGGI